VSDHPKLHTTFGDGEIRINAADFLSMLSTDDKRALAQRLACEGDVIVAVVGQLVTGYTEDASWGPEELLEAQRRRLIDALGTDVLKRVVRDAMQDVEAAKNAEKRADAEKDAVLRAVRDFTRDCDKDLGCRAIASALWKCRPEWQTSRHVTDADAVAYIEKVAGEIEVVRQAKAVERAFETTDEESPL
jgi:hypothetical protein